MKSTAEQIYEAIGAGYGYNGSKDQCIQIIAGIINSNKPDVSSSLAYKAINNVRAMYPTDIFPKDGDSLDRKSAEMARTTCDNIKRELDELVSGNDRQLAD